MRKTMVYVVLALLLCMICTGCGDREDMDDRRALVEQVVRIEEGQITFPEESGVPGWNLRGMQYYQGEAVQIWSVKNADDLLDIYLYREDGSREEILSGAPSEYGCRWFLDNEGNRFVMPSGGGMIRLDEDGGEIYRRDEGFVEDICQLSDGRMLMLIWKKDSGQQLAELDPRTGVASVLTEVELSRKTTNQFVGAGENGLLLMDDEGVWEVNLQNGSRESLMAFGAAYDPGNGVEDFRQLEDGRLEVLQKNGSLQKLELYDPVEGREVVLVRGSFFNDDMKQYAFWFNQSSEDYYVYLEECPEGIERLDFGNRTLVELGTGKGPDIIRAPLLDEEVGNLIESGYIEDLTPWMERTGIREEDYFPHAFDYPKVEEGASGKEENSGIYGVNISVSSNVYSIDRKIVGERKIADVSGLVDALLGYEGDGVFQGWEARRILGYFLEGSEDLWGMLDWQTGKCNFEEGLLQKMLEAAKRYADDGKGIRPVIFTSMDNANCYGYDYDQQQCAENGMVEIGYFYDDGQHGRSSTSVWMAMCSNSPCKEGAWAFLQFLLSDQVQENQFKSDIGWYPVSRKCYDEAAGQAIAEGAYGRKDAYSMGAKGNHTNLYNILGHNAYREIFDPTEEKVEKIRELLEDARPTVLKTKPILEIIYEEAESYFSGSKSMEEVVAVIQSRAQLYMDEHR